MNDENQGSPPETEPVNSSPPEPEQRPAVAASGPPPLPQPLSPFTEAELRQALVRPHRALDLVLGNRGRIAATVLDHPRRPLLILLLLGGGILFALPYGGLAPSAGWFKVTVLFTDSVLICFPSLHVFSRYLGFDLDFLHNLAFSLVISAVASMISFGFAPIIWFITATGGESETDLAFTTGVSALLLAGALLMGIIHMLRCLLCSLRSRRQWPFQLALTLGWLTLLVFIHYRMARFLGLLPWSV